MTRRKTIARSLLCLCMVLAFSFSAYAEAPGQAQAVSAATLDRLSTDNLRKICMVWGFAKYTHPAFLHGEKDWDQALFHLLDQAAQAPQGDDGAINEALNDWITALGPIEAESSPEADAYHSLPAEYRSVQADKGWTGDQAYLGQALCGTLQALSDVVVADRASGPVYFESYTFSRFTNEKPYPDMDYSDPAFRLLGLFRLWNAVEYYFPYRDIMDADWHEALAEYIDKMLDGSDETSYLLTLAQMGTLLNDAHVGLEDKAVLEEAFGAYRAPVTLAMVDGRFVVKSLMDGHGDSCPLQPGDVITSLDETPISEVIEDRLQYVSVPDAHKLLRKLEPYLLRSHGEDMMITVLRADEALALRVKGYSSLNDDMDGEASRLLDHNIGLINPEMLSEGDIHSIMTAFENTAGLIIDLRQYPGDYIVYSLAEYLLDSPRPFTVFGLPNIAVPGEFALSDPIPSGGDNPDFYKGRVAILMDQTSISQSEFTAMSLRNAPAAKVVGEASIGADGDVTGLPLPGGNSIGFTGLGIYTPQGEGTQRVGLTPDIPVSYTLEGVRDGRDEVMEAAIEYILSGE